MLKIMNDYVTKDMFDALEKRVVALEDGSGDVAAVSPQRPESLAEFLRKKGVKSDPDKVVCIAYFVDVRKGAEGFTSKDIEVGFRDARHTVPTNVSDQLARCAKRGMIQVSGKRDGKKLWVLTNTGIEYVESLNKQ